MSANAAVVDSYIAHRFRLIGAENAAVREILAILRRGEKQALGETADIYERFLARVRETGEPLEPWTPRGLKTQSRIIGNIEASLDGVLKPARAKLKDRLSSIAKDEQEAWMRAVERALPQPALDQTQLFRVPVRQLEALVKDQFGDRLTGPAGDFADQLREVAHTTMRRVNFEIENGLRDGDGIDGIVRRVRTQLGDESKFEHDIASTVRLQVMRTANDAAAMVQEENSDVVGGWQFVATLDDRTCPTCGPLDGEVFAIGEGPRPPLHPNCRCMSPPVVKSWQELGLPSTMSKANKDWLSGKPSERRTWSDWVMANEQRSEHILGKQRSLDVRAGRISLEDIALRRLNLEAA